MSPTIRLACGLRRQFEHNVEFCIAIPRRLSPWHHNPKTHHRVHNSSPLVPFWARWIHSTSFRPVSLRSILIRSCYLRLDLPSGLFPPGFPTKHFTLLFSLPCMPHAPPISFSPIKAGSYIFLNILRASFTLRAFITSSNGIIHEILLKRT
jgi:hypothetical protein